MERNDTFKNTPFMNKEMIMDKSLGIGRRDNFKLTFRGEFFFFLRYLVDETIFS